MSGGLAWVLVCVMGGVGAVARFVVDGTIKGRWTRAFPVATFVINVTGSFVIGVLAGSLAYGPLTANGYLLLATGFCGGYTTFSTAMVETVRLVQAGDVLRAVGSGFGTLFVCVGVAALGVGLASLVW
ncbi:fluoride efflux transporter CrcB [Luteimicrobium xylanilyticum]|uniref:Fluoride-specific ion channel FluC n=1 Tax=Luteimicrobium xylanilyticum TaxID=1133546 RepID=A0A5P9QEF0_9MICO|nr:CrcB family protein [Luteimicrobium xylanilyticum]QFU99858.1 Putative fluoride ion transporter CrcB [Luteimicrobium xylanilyticum]